MGKKNCWEVMKCGREVDGINSIDLGVCPVALFDDFEGINGGENGGRFCWGVTGTLCHSSGAQKLANCIHCKFMRQVKVEEGVNFVLTPKNLKREKTI